MKLFASGALTRKALRPIHPTCRSIKTRRTKIMNDALAAKLKYLHLGGLLAHWDDYLKLAGDQRFFHGRLLTRIVEDLYRVKLERLRELRLQKAHIPDPWVIDTFPFDRQPKLNAKKIIALYDSLTFMPQSQNIVWLGGTGVGKSGLATSFLIHAINHGYSGRYVLFAELLAPLKLNCSANISPMIAC